jgi:uncharacterized protein
VPPGTGRSEAGVEHHVLWHCGDLASSEHAVLTETRDFSRLEGVAALPLSGRPCHITYEVVLDPQWRPRRARAGVQTPSGLEELVLQPARDGSWRLNGATVPELQGCSDVDLGWTPATNTIPIRRLALGVGETATVTAAWVRFPELDVLRNVQRYTRLAPERWRYASGEYDFELVTDPASGLVLSYGDDLWRAAAVDLGRPRGAGGNASPPAP